MLLFVITAVYLFLVGGCHNLRGVSLWLVFWRCSYISYTQLRQAVNNNWRRQEGPWFDIYNNCSDPLFFFSIFSDLFSSCFFSFHAIILLQYTFIFLILFNMLFYLTYFLPQRSIQNRRKIMCSLYVRNKPSSSLFISKFLQTF